ncbi:hypothetical protein M413DRAFT_77629 [Hebeloma cylindrosporum]|uniref:Uncharacterized protein n=1 Tax=Hebeloma cylindrosporum TaxID=76867 RepID=A0A0C3BJJ5_HEBCY|nr:hypothetical protein M413DRAFT_77629 [Hebeloma cylindrosporum h7]
MAPPANALYNPSRPATYDPMDIPIRTQNVYWNIIERLEKAKTKKERSEIARSTGVSRLPLCAASVAFSHPAFFPLDPFHLFYENCMAFIWDIWTVLSKPGEIVHLIPEKAQELGKLIPLAMSTLPPAFCGPIRDPYLKRQSQYKVYEWMGLLHWYIVPIGIELGIQTSVLKNFSRFVEVVEFAMTILPRSDADLKILHHKTAQFLVEYERLYIGQDPEKILRARLCIFQLIHVPLHIQWNGSIRIGSQATVERSIGEMGHKIRSKKAPFANLTNLIYERELVKILSLYYPTVDPTSSQTSESDIPAKPRFMQSHSMTQKSRGSPTYTEPITQEIGAIARWLKIDVLTDKISVRRWGKLKLLNGNAVNTSNPPNAFNIAFGEALAFYQVTTPTSSHGLVVYRPLQKLEVVLNFPRGNWDTTNISVTDITNILNIVGIWDAPTSGKTYILRKHPGLAMLSVEESGIDMSGEDSRANEDEDSGDM